METNQEIETNQTRHERAWTAVRAHLARKREAEQKMVEDFHNDPVTKAALSRLIAENERRGTPIVKI